MVNWSALAGQKYAVMQQQADTAAAAQRSQAGLQAAQANSLGMLAPAQVAEMKARGGLYNAQAGVANTQADQNRIVTQFLPRSLEAELDAKRLGAQKLDLENIGLGIGLQNSSSTPIGRQVEEVDKSYGRTRRLKKGTAKVPGKGDGTKDTVNAKLAPGEAVLNKAAAEHMGRGLIEALNKLGAEKMGMV